MPGTIRVSVLEAVDLPEVFTDGPIGKDVTAKVTLGPKLFKTQPGVADRGTIASWNSDFAFPVMNLRDKLVISICDSEDQSVTQTAIEIPSIIQKGSRDEFVALNKGGRIHLRMSFVLTEEERKRIEIMRVAALKRKREADARLQKKTVIIQPITPANELKKASPLSTVAIKEVDFSTTDEYKKDWKEPAIEDSLDDKENATITTDDKVQDATITDDKKGETISNDKKDATVTDHKILDAAITDDKKGASIVGDKKKNSTPKPPAPKPMFNYAKAIGVPPSAKKKTVKKPSAAVSDSSCNELKADNCDVGSGGAESVNLDAKGEVVASETTESDVSVKVPAHVVKTAIIDSTSQGSLVVPTEETLDNEVKANTMNSEAQTREINADGAAIRPAESVVESPRLPETSSPTKFGGGETDTDSEAGDSEGVDSDEALWLLLSPIDSASCGLHSLQPSRRRRSSSTPGSVSSKSVKRRTLSPRPGSARLINSKRVSSCNSISPRPPPPLLVVWVQDRVRRALSNVKGCYGLHPSTVNNH